jgi:hypothetical protein
VAPTDELDRRIRSLNSLLKEKDLTESDRIILREVLETYTELRRTPAPPALSESDYQDLCRSLYRTVSLLEENYRRKLADRTQEYSGVIQLYEQMRRDVRDNYLYGNFRAVIDQCLDLQKEFGPDALTPDMGLLFALSLAEEGMLEEAVSIGEGILRKNEANPDLFYLKVKVTQWQLDLGRRDRASRTYNELTDRMDDQEELVGELKRGIAASSRSPLATTTPSPKEDEQSEGDSIQRVLEEVDALIQAREFDKAKILLIRYRLGTTDERTLNALDLAMKQVERAEEEILDQPQGMVGSQETDDVRLARQLIEEERFEEAIARLESMETSQAAGDEVQGLKEQAIEKLIQRERNRAARLFLAARDTQDRYQKEAYLKSSRDILKRILVEYPSSSLNEKIKSNLEIVEEELDRVSGRR